MTPVSVLIPVHNCCQYIAQSIESALVQEPLEVVVLDSGSTDNTSEIVSDYDVKLIRSDVNIGAPRARNRLIGESSGEYIIFMDADDYMMPGRIEHQYAQMEQSNSLFSYTDFKIEFHHGRSLPKRITEMESFEDGGIPSVVLKTDTFDLIDSFKKGMMMPATGCWMLHRSIFDAVQWDESDRYKYGMQDRKLILDILKTGLTPIHIDYVGFVRRSGWQDNQITKGDNYISAQRNFIEDLNSWLEG